MTPVRTVAAARPSQGSVTAETAVVLPAVVVMLAAALWAVAAVGAQLECVDAARTGARAASRGESLEQVRDGVLAAAPAGARVVVTRSAEVTRVEVSVRIRPRWGASLPAVTIRATAVSATEPGAER
ncbi:TadE family type IV pilus minor pilin [Streptosporangium canum]|uniref:TadE family type IV pilus minor pilin n=1 Tax=Streptosporangium canum TaxID=324952 RepID=UPI003696F905